MRRKELATFIDALMASLVAIIGQNHAQESRADEHEKKSDAWHKIERRDLVVRVIKITLFWAVLERTGITMDNTIERHAMTSTMSQEDIIKACDDWIDAELNRIHSENEEQE